MYKNLSITSKIMLPFGIGLVITFSLLYWIIVKYGMSGAPNAGIIILIVLAVLFVIIMLGELNIARLVLKPIRQMSAYAIRMASGDMSFEMEADRSNEMGKLVESFLEVQNSVKKIFSEVTSFEHCIESGNLTMRADISGYQGDFREITIGLNAIMDGISSLVKNVRDSSDLVSAEAKELSGGAQILAQGAEEQAASIEEISATIEHMSDYMKNTSANAMKAKKLSEDVQQEAEAGSNNMDRLLTTLNEINESSSNISKIMKNIEDIAFQTNILALNAAVEAARAGTAGKGFAVVAAEVKNLAAKSADAAKETNALLGDSIIKARDGLEIGKVMHASLGSIVSSVGNTVSAISDIAADSKNQADTVEQIDVGLTQISNIVQNNTATAEESASSSEEMAAQAALLKELVAKYRFRDDDRQTRNPVMIPSKGLARIS